MRRRIEVARASPELDVGDERQRGHHIERERPIFDAHEPEPADCEQHGTQREKRRHDAHRTRQIEIEQREPVALERRDDNSSHQES
jgi:hypothetical protein